MRVMIIRRSDNDTEAGVIPSEALLAAMGEYMEDMAKAGVLLGGDGLKPSSNGARVKFSKGKPAVIDGPFAETKELIAGYSIVEVKTFAEAVEWAKRWPAMDANGELELELRPYFETGDFGEEFTPELREREEKMRRELADKANTK
jgi:hypothetical protein